ncbi:MAG: ribonuclease III [Alphaproteobacteria bacterium]|nr:ribonuclease III [Alphaproteobacteria bacterium]
MKLTALFHRPDLLKQATTLSVRGRAPTYERLEFLGDRVLGVIVADMLYRAFPDEKEGALARRFVELTRAETLTQVAKGIGLPALLKTDEEELRANASVLSDVCEAVLGALYLDGGYDAARAFVESLWAPLMRAQTAPERDSKSALQEWAQRTRKTLPVYTLLEQSGTDHHPTFSVRVQIGALAATAGGPSKKAAEQAAAQKLMESEHVPK